MATARRGLPWSRRRSWHSDDSTGKHEAVYFQIIWDVLREPMQRALEALAMGLIVVLQGGLLLGKIHRSHRPLEVALQNAIDYIASFSTRSPIAPLAAAH